jgi:hypothetical protein
VIALTVTTDGETASKTSANDFSQAAAQALDADSHTTNKLTAHAFMVVCVRRYSHSSKQPHLA